MFFKVGEVWGIGGWGIGDNISSMLFDCGNFHYTGYAYHTTTQYSLHAERREEVQNAKQVRRAFSLPYFLFGGGGSFLSVLYAYSSFLVSCDRGLVLRSSK